LVHGGEDAEREPADDRDGQGHAPEEQRDREGLAEDLQDRACLVHERRAEVAADRLAEEDQELLQQGLVEAVHGREVLLRLGRERVGALGHGIERAARRGEHDQERHERHGADGRHQPQDALDDVWEQPLPPGGPRDHPRHYRIRLIPREVTVTVKLPCQPTKTSCAWRSTRPSAASRPARCRWAPWSCATAWSWAAPTTRRSGSPIPPPTPRSSRCARRDGGSATTGCRARRST